MRAPETQPGAAHFNPRSPHGERLSGRTAGRSPEKDFNPRSPHGERLAILLVGWGLQQYFNPRSPHGERLKQIREMWAVITISTHAPRTGSDGD